jgi:hypothetical protein
VKDEPMTEATRMDEGPETVSYIGNDPVSVRYRIETMEKLLERVITIPGTRQTVGFDALIGLIPVAGDIVGAAMGAYMIWEARNLNMPKGAMVRMAGNVGFDWLIGLVPGVGDAADFFFRSNTRNLRIIKRHLDKHHPGTATIDR